MQHLAATHYVLPYLSTLKTWSVLRLTAGANGEGALSVSPVQLEVKEKFVGSFEFATKEGAAVEAFVADRQVVLRQAQHCETVLLNQRKIHNFEFEPNSGRLITLDKNGDFYQISSDAVQFDREKPLRQEMTILTQNLANLTVFRALHDNLTLVADDYGMVKIFQSDNLLNLLSVMTPLKAILKDALPVGDEIFFVFFDKTAQFTISRMRKSDVLDADFVAQQVFAKNTTKLKLLYCAARQKFVIFSRLADNLAEVTTSATDLNPDSFHVEQIELIADSKVRLGLFGENRFYVHQYPKNNKADPASWNDPDAKHLEDQLNTAAKADVGVRGRIQIFPLK